MRFQMIDRHQRLFRHQRDRLGCRQSDDDAADQAGAGGGGDAVELIVGLAGLAHRFGDNQVDRFDMSARGDFRHHATIGCMIGDLAEHDIGQDAGAAVGGALDHRGGGLVAGRLDAEDDHFCLRPSQFREA